MKQWQSENVVESDRLSSLSFLLTVHSNSQNNDNKFTDKKDAIIYIQSTTGLLN